MVPYLRQIDVHSHLPKESPQGIICDFVVKSYREFSPGYPLPLPLTPSVTSSSRSTRPLPYLKSCSQFPSALPRDTQGSERGVCDMSQKPLNVSERKQRRDGIPASPQPHSWPPSSLASLRWVVCPDLFPDPLPSWDDGRTSARIKGTEAPLPESGRTQLQRLFCFHNYSITDNENKTHEDELSPTYMPVFKINLSGDILTESNLNDVRGSCAESLALFQEAIIWFLPGLRERLSSKFCSQQL